MTANSFDWDDELPLETEAEVYGALLRALRRKQGFGLFFVQCSKAQGERIVANLRQDLPQQRIQELHLQREVVTLYDQIAALWQQQPFEVLVIEGLQASLYAYEDIKRFSSWSSDDIYNYSWKGVPKILNHLNQQREHLRNDFPARFVFLVPPFVVYYFIQRAADFLDWRSGLFRFPRDPREIAQDAEQFATAGGYTKYLTLSPQARTEKILEIKSLQEICPDSENRTKLLHELGSLFAAAQDHKNAITSYDKALEVKPDDDATWFYRGITLYDLGRYEEAIASYDKALEVKPDDDATWFFHSIALSALGRYEEATASYDKALEVKPDDDTTWYNRGNALSALRRYEEAIASYDKALEVKPDDDATWFIRGNALSALGRYEEAIASYDKALEVKPDDDATWYNRGNALSALGRYEEAISSYDKALEVKPDDDAAWFYRGNALYDLGRYEEAIASYDKALEVKFDDDTTWFYRGNALSALRRYEEAIASYDKALEVKFDKHETWYNRGNALYDLGRYEEAIASYDKALEVKPDDDTTWFYRGNALYKLGRYEEAIASYDKALQIQPDYVGAYYNKACCYGLQKKIDLAIETLQRAISLTSECRGMAKTNSDFDGLRDDERFQALLGE